MKPPLGTRHSDSRRWGWYVNVLGASPLLHGRQRRRLLRSAGLDIETDAIGPGCYFHTSLIRIGPRSVLNYGSRIENVAPVEIGADTAIGLGATVATSTHSVGTHSRRSGEWRCAPVRIGDGCWLGARVTILSGVTIGDGSVIGAGAVVTDDCAADGLYVGVPARRVRDLPV